MRVAPLAVILALGAVLFAGGGCEAIVSSDVPAYTCTGTQLNSCPVGMYCNGSGCKACNPPGDDPCDGLDNDCNGVIDDGPLSDHDKDTYDVCKKDDASPTGFDIYDCDDRDPNVHPGAKEVCNGKDDDCNGKIDDGTDLCPTGQTCTNGECTTPKPVCTPQNCPAPNVCDPITGACGPPPTVDLGGACTSNTQCNSQLCGDSSTLGSTYTGAHGNVCTQTCCTSNDCPNNFVCFSPGTGGNYCVGAATLPNRGGSGNGAPGASCSSQRDCRSGLCVNSKCMDTCCSDDQCTSGTACTLSTASGANVFQCAPPPGSAHQNDQCSRDSDCSSGICYNYGDNTFPERHCLNVCCGSMNCGNVTIDIGFGQTAKYPAVCYDITSQDVSSLGNSVVPVCIGVNSAGTAGLGAACKQNSDCRSDRCDQTTSKCTDVCCIDSDCAAAGSNWKCRPQTVGSGTYLRCQQVK
jgi:hypothetical protein